MTYYNCASCGAEVVSPFPLFYTEFNICECERCHEMRIAREEKELEEDERDMRRYARDEAGVQSFVDSLDEEGGYT